MHTHRLSAEPTETAAAAPAQPGSDAALDREPFSLPPHPPPAPHAAFPAVASVAPVLAALVIWAITRSPYALVFAALGPVVAVGGVVDGRWQARRSRRRDHAAHGEALERLAARVRSSLARERARMRELHPSASAILASADGDVTRWRPVRGETAATVIAVGSGTVPSGIRLEGHGQSRTERELVGEAATLHDAPVTCDAAQGVGVLGPTAPARAVARGYLVQLVHALSPREASLVAVPEEGWEWARALPHFTAARGDPPGPGGGTTRIQVIEAYPGARAPVAGTVRGRCDSGSGPNPRSGAAPGAGARVATIAAADALERLPATCRTIVMLDGAGRAMLAGPGAEPIATELVSIAQAERYAELVSRHADSAGLAGHSGLPHRVGFADLFQPRPAGTRRPAPALACHIGVDAEGPAAIDLVRQGPHAVVGGTTGSGKSELLTTWVTAMAAAHTPDEVTFLLVDFKGGAAFAPLASLPHCVGVMTDLDHAAAARALASLGAELRRRERTLAASGAADIAEIVDIAAIADAAIADTAEGAETAGAHRLPRLVIVVDEFAAMLDALPELQPVLTDIAARGRSLGVHLILCTQRPAGAMREALLANCGLRLSLRVNNRADSMAVVGTDEAATLPQSAPGRCIVGVDGGTTRIQVATTSVDDIARVRRLGELAGPAGAAARPWLDPLPAMIPLPTLAPADAHGFVLGVEDVPQEQRQSTVTYRPERDGSLLAVGAHASGASTLLANLAAQRAWNGVIDRLGPGVEQAWDALCRAADRCLGGQDATPHLLLLADDIDSLHSRLQQEHQQQFADMLGVVLRDGPAAGVWLAATAQRLHGALAQLAPLFGQHLLLRLPNRQEHVLAGGDPGLFDERMPPGGCVWHGRRVQLAWPGTSSVADGAATDTAPVLAFPPGARYLLVSRAARSRTAQLRDALGDRVVVSGVDDGPHGAADLALHLGGGAFSRDDAVASVVVGDPDAWQAQWSLLATLRHDATMIFDSCSLADVRMLAHTRVLPPPLGPGPDRVWLCDDEGRLTRARLPRPANGRPAQ